MNLSIKESAMILKLPYIKKYYEETVKEAHMNELSYEEFLENILNVEVNLRKEHSIQSKIKQARFPYQIVLDDYKRNHLPVEIQRKIRELETLEFVNNDENIILIGNPGTGKTALAIALGYKACKENKKVLFLNASNLLIELREAMSQNQIKRYKSKFEKYDLVIVDELGYVSFDKQRGEVLFNLLSSRNEKGSTIITSNLTFDRWSEVFSDEILTGAIIDRLSYKSHLINMTGDSYRVIETERWSKQNETQI